MARNNANAAEAPVEILDEEKGPGMGIDIGICAMTSVSLIAAVVLVMLALGNNYGAGPFGG